MRASRRCCLRWLRGGRVEAFVGSAGSEFHEVVDCGRPLALLKLNVRAGRTPKLPASGHGSSADALGAVTLDSKAVADSHPYPHFLVLYFRGGFALACGVNGGVVGPSRVCRWRCLRLVGAVALVSLLNQVRAWSILKPSPNVCAPGGPSPVRAMNPPSIATRMLACCTVSRLLAGYFPVSFF